MPLHPTATLTGALEKLRASDAGITFIEGNQQEVFISYRELYTRAGVCLGTFQSLGLKEGDELIFQVEKNADFLILFWACLFGKIVPVPLSTGTSEDNRHKVFQVWKTLENPSLLCDGNSFNQLQSFAQVHYPAQWEGMKGKRIVAEEALQGTRAGKKKKASRHDIAFLQFTSGSTGSPKGVTLTHANLVINAGDIAQASQITPLDRMLSWMPLTHDMGMICFHLTGVLSGIHQFLMPATLFLRNPVLWIAKASEHKATLLYSPNFGYQYFLGAYEQHPTERHWDLSGVRLIYNRAEPISYALCLRFSRALQQYGLNSNCIFPGYGMAEAWEWKTWTWPTGCTGTASKSR